MNVRIQITPPQSMYHQMVVILIIVVQTPVFVLLFSLQLQILPFWTGTTKFQIINYTPQLIL